MTETDYVLSPEEDRQRREQLAVPLIRWQRAFFRCPDKDLRPVAKTLGALMTYADNYTLEAWPSLETLVRESGVSRTRVIEHINLCVDKGWIERISRGGSVRGTSTEYRLTIPTIDKPGPTDGTHIPDVAETGSRSWENWVPSVGEVGPVSGTPTTQRNYSSGSTTPRESASSSSTPSSSDPSVPPTPPSHPPRVTGDEPMSSSSPSGSMTHSTGVEADPEGGEDDRQPPFVPADSGVGSSSTPASSTPASSTPASSTPRSWRVTDDGDVVEYSTGEYRPFDGWELGAAEPRRSTVELPHDLSSTPKSQRPSSTPNRSSTPTPDDPWTNPFNSHRTTD
ncbi:hypothetical protein GTV32_02705 [Gordonia sp. SID5947]|nr:hypothetical protein [Gordonia sp. SID5947]